MELNDYQQAAERTAKHTHDVDSMEKRLTNFGLGLAGEAGEVADLIKKHIFHHQPLDQDKLKREIGDVLWYIAMLSTTMGTTLSDIAELNIAKLMARYPDGFDAKRSTVREGDAR